MRGAAVSGRSPYAPATSAAQPRVPPYLRTACLMAAATSTGVACEAAEMSLVNSASARAAVSRSTECDMAFDLSDRRDFSPRAGEEGRCEGCGLLGPIGVAVALAVALDLPRLPVGSEQAADAEENDGGDRHDDSGAEHRPEEPQVLRPVGHVDDEPHEAEDGVDPEHRVEDPLPANPPPRLGPPVLLPGLRLLCGDAARHCPSPLCGDR